MLADPLGPVRSIERSIMRQEELRMTAEEISGGSEQRGPERIESAAEAAATAFKSTAVSLGGKLWHGSVDGAKRAWARARRNRSKWKLIGLFCAVVTLCAGVNEFSKPAPDQEVLTWVGVIAGLSVLFAAVGPAVIAWVLVGLLVPDLSPTAALTRLGSSAGAGTAAGLFIAVFTFYWGWFDNSQPRIQTEVPISGGSGYDPTLLLTLPALGAVVGFGLGLVAVVVDAAAQSRWPDFAIPLSPIVLPLIVLATSQVISPARSMEALIEMLLINDPRPETGSWLSQVAEQRDSLIDAALPVPWLVVGTAAVTACYAFAAWQRAAPMR